jgi:hypothetical protein
MIGYLLIRLGSDKNRLLRVEATCSSDAENISLRLDWGLAKTAFKASFDLKQAWWQAMRQFFKEFSM